MNPKASQPTLKPKRLSHARLHDPHSPSLLPPLRLIHPHCPLQLIQVRPIPIGIHQRGVLPPPIVLLPLHDGRPGEVLLELRLAVCGDAVADGDEAGEGWDPGCVLVPWLRARRGKDEPLEAFGAPGGRGGHVGEVGGVDAGRGGKGPGWLLGGGHGSGGLLKIGVNVRLRSV